MGSISYDGLVVVVDDRTLTHLQIVIVNKLRRGEAFLMSWKDSVEAGSGRSAIWMHPQVLIYFKFDGSRVPAINERWLRELADSAESSPRTGRHHGVGRGPEPRTEEVLDGSRHGHRSDRRWWS
jgi:hypothetical protein